MQIYENTLIPQLNNLKYVKIEYICIIQIIVYTSLKKNNSYICKNNSIQNPMKTHLFTYLFLLSVVAFSQPTKAIDALKAKGVSAMQTIENEGLWANRISMKELASLPVGIKTRRDGDNATYAIGISKAVFHEGYTEVEVFAKVDIPQKGDDGRPISLFFGATNIKLSKQGGIIGEAKLALLGDISIPINKDTWQLSLYGGFDMSTGKTEDLTYAEIDCDGFKKLKLSGAVEFSRNLILPLENATVNEAKESTMVTLSNGRQMSAPNRVRGLFNIEAASWNDIVVKVSLEPFVLAKKQNGQDYEGNFQFLVKDAVLDLSDLKNDDAVKFPNSYQEKGLLLPSEDLWKGIYVDKFEIGLPVEFKTSEKAAKNERVRVGASGLIIDKYGLSGDFFAENVFTLNEGITDKENAWAYSLDYLSVQIETNRFVKAQFRGEIVLPVTKMQKENNGKKLGLNYEGLISEGDYKLVVQTKDTIAFDIWKAKAQLFENSSVELRVAEGHFLPKANLHGRIDFAANRSHNEATTNTLAKKTLDFKGITFENLTLQTVSPMIQVGNMSYKGDISFGNFPVSIKRFEVKANDKQANLYFDLALNLMDKSEFAAEAKVGILGELSSESARTQWQFKGLDVSAIKIDTKFSGFTMRGQLDLLENHPVYGNGFNADLQVSVNGGFDVKAKAIFGRKEFRYWYFDASAKLSTGYLINGFGGGAYYKMRRADFASPSEFSPTGLTYEPDPKAGLGLKALVSFAIGSDKVFNGEAAFEMRFNQRGGLDYASIYGKGNVLAEIPGLDQVSNLVSKVNKSLESKAAFLRLETNPDNQSSFQRRFLPMAETAVPSSNDNSAVIQFKAAIQFDIENNSTHGTLDTYINGGFIAGLGENGRAAWAVFHKDPKDWYLYIGTPDDRAGIKLGVGSISLKTGSYFMAGTQLPGSPPPPVEVAQILGRDINELNYMRDENTLANAGGIAFGSNLSIDTGDLAFLIFYANFKAGVGFDLMLKDYGEAACKNTGKQVGINGWYANGQSYAYLHGELGLRIKLLFVRMKVPIIQGSAAVLMQAKLPNPFWMRGYVAGNMNILGGLIKGRFNFKVTLGEQCEFANSSVMDGMKIITDVSPKNNSEKVDVFTTPQATFSMKVNEPIVIPDDNGKTTYKIILEKFEVVDDKGQAVAGGIEWSRAKDRANFVSTDILPPNKSYKAKVEVSFQKQENGIFRPIMENGQIVKEIEVRTFTTGDAPNHIPLQNIEYAYPVVDQKYFFKEEYDKGYIKLKRGQDYLFDIPNWETEVHITQSDSNKAQKTSFVYDSTTNEISYTMPEIKTSQAYQMSIISYQKGKKEPQQKEQEPENINIKETQEGNDYEIAQKKAEELSKEGEINRLIYAFASSKHRTFSEKIAAVKVDDHQFENISPRVKSLKNMIKKGEPFEEMDLVETAYTGNQALISVEAALDDAYFREDIKPILYSQLPIDGRFTIKNRDVQEYGLVPKKAISIDNYYLTSVRNNIITPFVLEFFPYIYDISFAYMNDYKDIENQIVSLASDRGISQLNGANHFLRSDFKSIRKGDYKILMRYTLPGNKKTSEGIQIYKKW